MMKKKSKKPATRESQRAASRKYYLANAEEFRRKAREHYWKHRAAHNTKNRKYYQEHQEELKATARERYAADPQAILEARLEWRKAHPEKVREYNARYRAKRRLLKRKAARRA